MCLHVSMKMPEFIQDFIDTYHKLVDSEDKFEEYITKRHQALRPDLYQDSTNNQSFWDYAFRRTDCIREKGYFGLKAYKHCIDSNIERDYRLFELLLAFWLFLFASVIIFILFRKYRVYFEKEATNSYAAKVIYFIKETKDCKLTNLSDREREELARAIIRFI